MKKVCVVGYGAIGPIHAESIIKTENAQLWGICDPDGERLAKGVSRYDVRGYSNFDSVINDENVDSVHICTPHYLHFEMIEKALKAKKCVVCEKPVVMTKEEYVKLLELDGADRICVVMQNRLNPSVRKLKNLICIGKLGKIQMVKGVLTWHRTPEYYQQDPWRGKWETEGGGVVINQAIHTLDLISYLAGNIKSVKATTLNFALCDIEVEDTCNGRFEFENGATGVFFVTNAYGENSAPDIEIVFEKGRARYVDSKLYINGELCEEDSKATGGKDYWGRSHEELIADFYDKNKFFSPFDVKNIMNVVFGIYKSAKTGGKKVLL